MSLLLRASAETRLAKKEWAEPKTEWLPLGRGVFGLYALQPGALRDCADVLKTESGASQTEINPVSCTFSFHFFDGRPHSVGGAPWKLLAELRDTVEAADENDAAHLHRTDARPLKILIATYKATSLVWQKLMVMAFARAVSEGAVKMYARLQSVSAPLTQLPPDVWPYLIVADWQHGVADAPDGSRYWSVHVEICAETVGRWLIGGPQRAHPDLDEMHQKVLSQVERQNSLPALKKAPTSAIHEAIRQAYSDAEIAGRKPPNIKELPDAVLPLLRAKGYRASGKRIMKLGRDPEHSRRRRPPGKTLRSERGIPPN